MTIRKKNLQDGNMFSVFILFHEMRYMTGNNSQILFFMSFCFQVIPDLIM